VYEISLSYPVSITNIENLSLVQNTKFSNNLLKSSELFKEADNSELEMTFFEFFSTEHPFLI
jgi:hypothetical protein